MKDRELLIADPVAWSTAFPIRELATDEAHLWKANLDEASTHIACLFGLLNAEEQERARHFIFEQDRNRFAAARGILRCLLADYLNLSPKELEFTADPSGKPALRNNAQLRFNLSHSDNLALYAFAQRRELGVDVEKLRHRTMTQAVVEHHFSEREQVEFAAFQPEEQAKAFLRGWTRKEAYLKAKGVGLRGSLKDFDVSLHETASPILRSEDAGRWRLYSFCPASGFVAALVVERENHRLCYWQWRVEQVPVLHGRGT